MVLERRIKKRDLNKLDILIKDTSNEFLQVFDVPDTLPQGRSSFTVNGSEFLKTNTEVLVEILDNGNNPIFVNAIFDPSYVTMQGTSRSISVEIYPTTPAGRAVLTIVGELDHTKFIGSEPLTPELLEQLNIETDPIFTGDVSVAKAVADNFFIPKQYQGVYNVKFNKIIQINPKARNTQQIRFYRKPQIQVRELIRTEIKPSASIFIDTVNVSTGSISGKRVNPEKTLRLINPAEITPVRAMISCDAKPAPQGGYTDLVGPNTLQGTIYNRAYPLELTSEDSYGSIIRRSWEFGDTHVTESFSVPDATNPKGVEKQTHIFTKSGTYTAKLTVASPTGQYDLDTETITLSAPSAPVTDFTVTHPTASADGSTKQTGSMEDPNGRTFKFKDTSTGVDNIVDPLIFGSKFTNISDTEYSWSFGDGNTANGLGDVTRYPIHTYIQSGSFNVALTVKNNYGTQTDTETKSSHILIQPSLPIVDFSVNSGSITEAQAVGATAAAILGATATFTNSTVYYGSSITYAWTFNSSGSTSTATSPTCIYTGSTYVADTTFDVTLVATDNFGRSVTKTKKNLISVTPSIPAPNFTSNIQEFTLTGSFEAKRVEYTDTSTSDTDLTYKYDFNGGTTGSNLNTHAGSTTFEAADLSGGIFEAGVGGDLTLGITFENPRAGTRCLKLYNGGSSVVSDAYNYGYDYGNSGEATLSAWISQYSLATITRNHMYTMEFWARADEPTEIMTGMFGANSNGYIFGSGASQGTFAIKGQKVGTSWQKFNWTFRFTDVGCQYLTIRLGASLNAGKAVYFDNVEVYKSTSTVKDPRIDYRTKTDGARGLVKQSVTNTLGKERSIQLPNFINAQFGAPSGSFTIDDSSILTEVPVTFEASGSSGFTNISEYRWDWGDGNFDTTKNPNITHKYESAATYVPKLTVISSEGQSTQVNRGNVVVSAPAAPTVALSFLDGSTTTGETPHEVLVKATIGGQATASNITFGNGDTTNSTKGFTVYKTPGIFTITATASGPGGSVSDTITIVVSPVPEPPIEETVEDPEPEITADIVIASETGTQLGSGGGNDPTPPAPYTGGGGGGDPYTGCVLAGTIIKTARGDIPVEQVTTDDLVYSYNFDSGEFAYYKIEKAWSKKQPTRVFVETESGKSVECSDTHLFYHPDYVKQEVMVKNLTVGDIIYTVDDDENVIEDPIRNIVTYDEEVEVYNFNVPDIYSYITNDIVSHNKETKYESGAPNPFNTPFQMELASPETEEFEIQTNQTNTFFKKEMLGADLTIFPSTGSTDMATLNKDVPADRRFIIKQQPLVTKIRKLGARGRVIIPDIRGLMVTNRLNSHKGVVFSEYQDFGPSGYSMSYQKPVTASFRVINKQSYSKINLTQLRPYSGDVSKVKVYYKTPGDVGGFKLLADSTLEAPEQLADPTIQFGRLKIGYIPIQQHIDYYWFSRQGIEAGFYEGIDSSTPTAGLTYVNDPYVDSMRISGSNYPYNSVVAAFHKYPMRLVAGTEYSLRFQLAGIKKNKQHTPENAAATGDTYESVAKIRFYMSGSSLKGDDGWGNLLGIMELDSATAVSESFDYVEHNFIAKNNGIGRLQLVAESGEWYMGDLSVKPMRESGFSPDFSSLVVPTPKLSQRPTNVEYYAEFYDLNGNASDLMAIGQSAKIFQGSSLIIEGVDNTVSGSLFLGGDTEGSGIEIHGGSSYVRNVGYVGYYSASQRQSVDDPTLGKAGFMMWSGSLLTDITDEYNVGDVGFEIHGGPGVQDGTAGAMRFRSSTGKLEVTGSIVATEGHFSNNFSVGTGSAAIEISASRYIMKTKNWNHPTSSKGWAISGSGQAYFQEGYIGGWQIRAIDEGTSTERSIISGSNITLDAGGAALYMSNKGPGSDSGATFPVLADEYYLDFTPDSSEAVTSANYYVSFGPKFKIDKEGTMFASGAKFVGTITASAGFIGGFNIGSASIYGGGTSEGSPDFFLSGSRGHGSSGYLKPNLLISASGFQVTHDGAMQATSGSIGGWDIGSTLSNTNILLDPATPKITLGSKATLTDGNTGLYLGTDGIALGASSVFKVTSAGALTATSATITGNITATTGTIGGWTVGSTLSATNILLDPATPKITLGSKATLTDSNAGLYLGTDGVALGASSVFKVTSAGAITSTSGTIGGWTLASTEFSAGSGGTYIALIPGTGIQMGHATFGSAPFSVTNAGVLKATSGTIGGFTLSSDNLTATNFTLSPSGKSIALGSGDDIFIVDGDVGMQLGDATFADAPFSVTKAGVIKAESGTIGGWTVTGTQITSSGLTLDSSGDIRSTSYQPRVTGWRISSQANGTAEFENVRIRGTLATTTFEKETVNAVGGQLWVGNSSMMSESISSVQTNILLDNVSGFQKNEVLIVKKSNPTGFTKEYMLITGSKRINQASDTDFSGHVHVTRGYGAETSQSVFLTGSLLNEGSGISTTIGIFAVDNFQGPTANAEALRYKLIKIDDEKMFVTGSTATTIAVERGVDGCIKATHVNNAGILVADDNTSFLSGLVSPQASYDPGQVIVSTGRYIGGTGSNTTGSGYIRLNANPKDGTTPFIDFVERTGSGVYDVKLRARLGDLSGLVNTEYGTATAMPKNPGFGLASENVFLKGTIKATSGSIAGIKMESSKLWTGTGTHANSNTGFYLDDSANFSLGDKLSWDGSNLAIEGSITITGGTSIPTAAAISGSLAGQTGSLDTATAGALTQANTATTNAATAQTTANSKNEIFRQTSTPTAIAIGDLWYDTDDGNKLYVATATGTGNWQATIDGTIATAQSAAVAAQGAIDTMETQLVLDSGGMGLWSDGGVASGFLVADYGTTTKFYDGVDDLAANVKLQLSAAGITAYGDNTTTYASFNSSGVTLVDNSVTTGTFTSGTVTLYGASSNDRVVINNTGMSIYSNNVLRASALDAGFTAYGDDVNTYAAVTSAGLTVYEDSTNMANFGSTMRVGVDATDKSALRVAADGTLTIGTSNTTNVTISAAGAVTISGAITATSGTIGGWTAAGTLSATNIVLNPSTPSIYLAGKSSFGANVDGVWIGTDGISIGDADEFNVTNAGVLTATSATITGAITATSGTFSGTINASGGTFTGNVTAGGAKFGLNVASTNDGLYLDSNNHWYDSGVLTTNSITATGGTIGGFIMDSDSLVNAGSTTNATSGLIKSTTAGDVVLFAGADDANAGDANFSVKNNGTVEIKGTIDLEKQTGGSSQGLTMDGGSSGDMNLIQTGANPFLRMGATNPLGTSRLQVGRGGTGNNNQVSWHTGGDGTDGGGLFSGAGDNQKISMGMQSSGGPNSNWLMGHKNIYNRYTIFGSSDPGEYIMNVHSTNNNLEINGSTDNPAYTLSVNGDIYATGNITAYSDVRRKKEITTLQNALDRVLQLRGVNYRWRRFEEVAREHRHLLPHDHHSSHGPHDQTDYESVQMGLIAQEAQDIIPEVVLENPENGCLSIDYAHMTGLLVEAIKDLNKKVDEQGKVIRELQNA